MLELSKFRDSENMTPRLKTGVNQLVRGPRGERGLGASPAGRRFLGRIRAPEAKTESAARRHAMPAVLVFMRLRGRWRKSAVR